ncbi:WD40 repeat domain-containing protein [Limnospira sp. PMC 289.06]|uniref:WD40 repeat domain-containing protein n=1 Tax=Limnospira sp. PMC 289.06 TaxID=2981094 RepID=UPI0028E0F5CC|nr:WD40 repeat domain-containing protein [Limnospira sp. PMC 289.06]
MTTALGQWLSKLDSEKRLQLLRHQLSDFAKAGEVERLRSWLTDFGFLQHKLEAVGIRALISDYDLVLLLLSGEQGGTLKLIQEALGLSADVLAEDSSQLAGQLWGRLLSVQQPEIVALLKDAQQWRDKPWFRPFTGNLIAPGGPLICTLTGHTEEVNAVTIALDGKTAVSGSEDRTLKWWDLATGEEIVTLRGHSGAVNTVAIAPDGKTAVSGSEDKTLKWWYLSTGWEIATLRGHTDSVTSVAIAPDGKTAVSGSGDRTLKVWDLSTGLEVATLRGHTDWVRSVAIAPDGRTAISASDDR